MKLPRVPRHAPAIRTGGEAQTCTCLGNEPRVGERERVCVCVRATADCVSCHDTRHKVLVVIGGTHAIQAFQRLLSMSYLQWLIERQYRMRRLALVE